MWCLWKVSVSSPESGSSLKNIEVIFEEFRFGPLWHSRSDQCRKPVRCQIFHAISWWCKWAVFDRTVKIEAGSTDCSQRYNKADGMNHRKTSRTGSEWQCKWAAGWNMSNMVIWREWYTKMLHIFAGIKLQSSTPVQQAMISITRRVLQMAQHVPIYDERWDEAVIDANVLRNGVFGLLRNMKGATRADRLPGRHNIFLRCVCFSKAVVHVSREKRRWKLAYSTVTGVLVGYHTNGIYRILISNDISYKRIVAKTYDLMSLFHIQAILSAISFFSSQPEHEILFCLMKMTTQIHQPMILTNPYHLILMETKHKILPLSMKMFLLHHNDELMGDDCLAYYPGFRRSSRFSRPWSVWRTPGVALSPGWRRRPYDGRACLEWNGCWYLIRVYERRISYVRKIGNVGGGKLSLPHGKKDIATKWVFTGKTDDAELIVGIMQDWSQRIITSLPGLTTKMSLP